MLSQFSVCAAPGGRAGFLMDIQSRLLDGLATRVVMPLLPLGLAPRSTLPALNPIFVIGGDSDMLMGLNRATLSVKHLRRSAGTLDAERDEIVRAVEALISGL
jgi:toxin CcdB